MQMRSFIKNTDMPSCVNCVHFIEPKMVLESEQSIVLFGKCKLFGDKNLVTGKIDYKFASDCRHSKSGELCGVDGKYFDESL